MKATKVEKYIRNFLENKKLFSRLLFAFIIVITFFTSHYAFAAEKIDANKLSLFDWEAWVFIVLGWTLVPIITLVGKLFTIVTSLLTSVITYNDYIYTTIVTVGWETARDISNLFFVLILLAIAIGTILNLDNYNYKRALPKLILMAILINFSKTICGLIIDFSQVFTHQFASVITNVGAQQLYLSFGIQKLFTIVENGIAVDKAIDVLDIVMGLLVGLILITISFTVVTVYLVVFVFRIVTLWILIVLSPLAFLLSAWPGGKGQGYAREWWDKFMTYVFIGPVLMFFFWLALTTSGRDQALNIKEPGAPGVFQGSLSSEITNPNNLARFIVTTCLLMAGLFAAKRSGVVGSQLAGNAISRIQRTAMGAVRGTMGAVPGTGSWAARKIKAGKAPFGIGRGYEFNPFNIASRIKETFANRKAQEIKLGNAESGEGMRQGGLGGFIKSWGSRDASEAYLRGGFGIKGAVRAFKTITGGPGKVAEVMKEVEKEKKEARLKLAMSENRKAALGKSDHFEDGKKRYVEQQLPGAAQEIERRRMSGDVDENYDMVDDGKGGKKRRSIDEAMREKGIDPTRSVDELRAAGETDAAALKEQFLKKWDEDKARPGLEANIEQNVDEALATGNNPALLQEINGLGKDKLNEMAQEKTLEAQRLEAGGLSSPELEENGRRLLNIQHEIVKLLKEIRNNKDAGLDTQALEDKLEGKREEASKIGTYDAATGAWGANKDVKWLDTLDKDLDAKDRQKRIDERGTRVDAWVLSAKLDADKYTQFASALDWSADERREKEDETKTLKQESIDAAKRQKIKKAKAESYIPPQAFYSSRDRATLENEESRKITSNLSEELIGSFRDALSSGDTIKGISILKKLAHDGNDNEFLDNFGFQSSSEGMHDFFDAVIMGKKGVKLADGSEYDGPGFKVGEQMALGIENEIGDINESVRHWETARLITVENGQYRRNTPEEHTKVAFAEIAKMSIREIVRVLNRLAYGSEVPMPDGSRKFELEPLGMAILKMFGNELGEEVEKKADYNKNAVINIGSQLDLLKNHGVAEKYRNAVEMRINQIGANVGEGVTAIVDKFFDAFMEEADARAKKRKS